jgi:hypothetical protein
MIRLKLDWQEFWVGFRWCRPSQRIDDSSPVLTICFIPCITITIAPDPKAWCCQCERSIEMKNMRYGLIDPTVPNDYDWICDQCDLRSAS